MRRLYFRQVFWVCYLLLNLYVVPSFASSITDSNFFDENNPPIPTQIAITHNGTQRDLNYIKTLGAGGFSRTLHVEDRVTKEQFALGVMRPQSAHKSAYFNIPEFISDLTAKPAKHLAPIELIDSGSITINGTLYALKYGILTPVYLPSSRWMAHFNNQSNSSRAILDRVRFAEKIFEQGAAGLQELANLGYYHSDVKPENMVIEGSVDEFLTGRGRLRLIDFDLAQRLAYSREKIVGTPLYFPPEIIMGMSDASDIRLVDLYGLGHSIYEIIFSQNLYADMLSKYNTVLTTLSIVPLLQENNFDKLHDHVEQGFKGFARRIQESDLSPSEKRQGVNLIEKMRYLTRTLLSYDPLDRIPAVQAHLPDYAQALMISPKPGLVFARKTCPVVDFLISRNTSHTIVN